jgi:hypothetical protein
MLSQEHDYQEIEISPERKLLSAMILRAWSDLYSSNRILQSDARFWFASNQITHFSFAWCCQYLGLPLNKTRQIIKKNHYLEKIQKVSIYRYKKVHCAITQLHLFLH